MAGTVDRSETSGLGKVRAGQPFEYLLTLVDGRGCEDVNLASLFTDTSPPPRKFQSLLKKEQHWNWKVARHSDVSR